MEIQEIKAKKEKLIKDIDLLVLAFEDETKCLVSAINFTHEEVSGARYNVRSQLIIEI